MIHGLHFQLWSQKQIAKNAGLATNQADLLDNCLLFIISKIGSSSHFNWLGGVFGYHVRLTRGRSGVRSSPESKKDFFFVVGLGLAHGQSLASYAFEYVVVLPTSTRRLRICKSVLNRSYIVL